jgi:hypothetical protein
MRLVLIYRFLMAFCSLMLFAGALSAQDDETANTIDSLIAAPKILDETVSDEDVYDDDGENMPIDTSIISRIRSISSDTLALMKRDKGFYYQTYLDSLLRAEQGQIKPKKKSKPVNLPDISGLASLLTYLLWALGIGILLFVLYKLFLSKQGLFASNRKNISATIETNLEEEISPDQFESLIKKAAAEGNYRLAVRYLYLQSLHQLSEKGYVVIGTEKTNYQYLNEIRKRSSSVGSSFAPLTLKYEYIWYGEYEIANTAYFILEKDFKEFKKQI